MTTLSTPTARKKLSPRGKAYGGPVLDRGITLMYRRNATTAGVWIVRGADGKGGYWQKGFADADDLGFPAANGTTILTFGQAQIKAGELARADDSAGHGKPMTVAEALDAYEADLKARGRREENIERARFHLQGTALLNKPVAMLKPIDLLQWRNALIAAGMKPATFNRTKVGLRAALSFAATLDDRITNHQAFKAGLKKIAEGDTARCAVMTEAELLRVLAEAQAEGGAFALVVAGLAHTGARLSQLRRITCEALRQGPKLMVPRSYKGNEHKVLGEVALPIDGAFALTLAAARAGRPDNTPLFVLDTDETTFRRTFAKVVERAGLDPEQYTPYALRHTSICRMLLAGVLMTMVAKLHDTSVKEIEKHYAAHIEDVAGDMARRGVLRAPVDNVVVLHKA